MSNPEPHLSEVDASGGKKLGVMRYVLGGSLTLVVALFVIILMIYR